MPKEMKMAEQIQVGVNHQPQSCDMRWHSLHGEGPADLSSLSETFAKLQAQEKARLLALGQAVVANAYGPLESMGGE